MKVTTQAEPRLAADQGPQFIKLLLQILTIVLVAIIGMGRGHHMLNAIRRRHAAHLLRNFPGFGAIVDFGKDVTVNIDQDESSTNNLSRFHQQRPSTQK